MTRHPSPWPRLASGLRAILVAIALLALLAPLAVVLVAPRRHAPLVVQRIPAARVVPPDTLPPVEPVRFVDLPPDEARAYNADVPFVRGPIPAARALSLRDGPADLARATDCLAAAVVYEAGNDPAGQRAVAQVVLNRVRHPAFPKTVCGVVFEGQDRRTGCQFSFTCDGAMTRWRPTPAMWAAARTIAADALAGAVYRPVGYATHYHTDWVVPYWQASLDKIARVHSHLFFRWTGWWGTPAAFGRAVDATEPAIAQLAVLSDAHGAGDALAAADAAFAEAAAALVATAPAAADAPAAPAADSDGVYLVALPRGNPDIFPAMASMTCGGAPYCKYLGWTDAKAVPATPALDPAQVASMAFSYLRDRASGIERTLWNCAAYPRPQPSQCMRRQPPPAIPATAASALRTFDLAGVRRAPASIPAARTGTASPSTRLHDTDDRKEP